MRVKMLWMNNKIFVRKFLSRNSFFITPSLKFFFFNHHFVRQSNNKLRNIFQILHVEFDPAKWRIILKRWWRQNISEPSNFYFIKKRIIRGLLLFHDFLVIFHCIIYVMYTSGGLKKKKKTIQISKYYCMMFLCFGRLVIKREFESKVASVVSFIKTLL